MKLPILDVHFFGNIMFFDLEFYEGDTINSAFYGLDLRNGNVTEISRFEGRHIHEIAVSSDGYYLLLACAKDIETGFSSVIMDKGEIVCGKIIYNP